MTNITVWIPQWETLRCEYDRKSKINIKHFWPPITLLAIRHCSRYHNSFITGLTLINVSFVFSSGWLWSTAELAPWQIWSSQLKDKLWKKIGSHIFAGKIFGNILGFLHLMKDLWQHFLRSIKDLLATFWPFLHLIKYLWQHFGNIFGIYSFGKVSLATFSAFFIWYKIEIWLRTP